MKNVDFIFIHNLEEERVYQLLPDRPMSYTTRIPEHLEPEIDHIITRCEEIGLEIKDTYFKCYSTVINVSHNKLVVDFGDAQLQIYNVEFGLWHFLHPTNTILNIESYNLKKILARKILPSLKNSINL